MTDQLKSYCRELLRMLTNLRTCNVAEDRDGYFLTAGRCWGYVDGLRESGSVTGEVAKRMGDLVASACANSWRGALPDPSNVGPCIPFCIAIDRRRAAEQPPVHAAEPAIRPSWLDGGLEALEMVKEDMTAAEPVAARAESKPKKGWGWPGLAKAGHYFIGGQSICGRWLYMGPVYAADYGDLRHCSVCKRKLAVKPQAQVLANEPEQVPAPAPSRNLRLLCLLVPSRAGGTRALPVHTLRPVPPRVGVQGRWNLASETGFHLRETQATAPSPEVLEHYLRLGQADTFRTYPRTIRTGVSQ